jgi:hypothetical protein
VPRSRELYDVAININCTGVTLEVLQQAVENRSRRE